LQRAERRAKERIGELHTAAIGEQLQQRLREAEERITELHTAVTTVEVELVRVNRRLEVTRTSRDHIAAELEHALAELARRPVAAPPRGWRRLFRRPTSQTGDPT
jgi:hypothetical protein